MRRGGSAIADVPIATASEGETATLLSEVMAGVLEVEAVPHDSDFFEDLGADSMMMAHFCARLRKLPDAPSIAIKQVYQHSSIGALAASIEGTGADAGHDPSGEVPTSALPEQPPRTVAPAVPVSRVMYWLCGLLQLATAAGLILLGAFLAAIGYEWVAASSDVIGLYGRSAAFAGSVFVGLSIVPILLKWMLVWRWKPGRFRLWGLRYYRFWLVRVLLRANPLALFAGSPIYNLYLRALGARVGRGVVFQSRPIPVCADLLTVGDNAVIRKDSLITGYRANAGWIELGPVTIGADAVVGELTVLDIETSVGDGAQLGHQSALDAGQSIPSGERWIGVSSHERVEVDVADIAPVEGSRRRRILYPIFQLVALFGLTLPIGTSIVMTLADWQIAAAAELENHTVQWRSALFYEEVLAFSLAVFVVLALFRLFLATVLPRLFRRAIRPGEVYPLFGWRYGIHRLIQRFTNARFFPRLLGDSSYIVHYLHLLGYDISFEEQTGSNFSQTIKQDNPYAVSVGAGTMVADVISLINADYSNTSFRVSELSIGAHSFYGNSIAYPANATTGDDCLHASKVAVPVDGEVRDGVGFLGSPSFEIPRTVFRDAELAEPKDERGRPLRLGAKNRHNLVTIGWFVLTRLLGTAGAVGLFLAATDVYPRFGAFAFAASSFTGLVAGTLYLILVERASVGFKRLVPLSCSIYDRQMWRHERFWKLSSQPRVFNGTPFKAIVWRLYGVTMGKRVFDDGCTIIEKTMATVGDGCTLNAGSIIQPHSQEDGALKSDYTVLGSGCTVGINALVHYGVTMRDGSTLGANAFLMKGNDVPAGTYWGENPAREIDTVVTVDGADDRERTDPVTATAEQIETSRPYWRDLLLAGGPTVVPRWSRGDEEGVGTVSTSLDDLAAELQEEADAQSVSVDALVVAAHAKVLATMSGDPEILTGLVPVDGGPATPFRLSTEPSTWQALAALAEEASQEHAAHQGFPVDSLRDELHLAGPPFEVALDLSGPAGDLDDGTVWRVSLVRAADSMTLVCDHRLEAVDADAAARVLAYHHNALASMVADSSQEHAGQILLSDDELTFQLEGLAGPERNLPDRRLHELFEDAVREHPDAIAAVFRDETLTYRELNARANRIGRALLARGVQRETVVAVVTERNLDWMATVLAIFKAGGVYLPIEPHFPAERIARTLGRAECTLVVTEYGSGDNLFDALGSLDGVDTLFVTGAYRETDESDLGIEVGEDQLAYIYFTSGSTGEPKGAMCEHAGMINHLYAKIDDFEIGPGAVVAQIAPQCFDISLWQLVSALLVGGRTLIVEQEILLDPEQFLDRIVGGEVAVAQVVPSYLEVLLSYLDHHPRELNDLQCVSVTGEALSLELTHRWFGSQPDIKLANAYGLTETSDDTNHEVMDRPPAGDRVPLGPAVNNVSVRVVDPGNLQLVPLGAPGEIVFAGVCVGRGYINDPERTAQAFLDDPLQEGQRLYRSGDFGFWRPDGKLEFLGRRDAQVKIRGFRIEIGSIENHMLTVPGVHQAAVVVLERPDGAKQLVGFVAGESVEVDTVRERLEEALPEYMVPPAIHLHDGLPTTDNGKIDRKSLRAQAAELDVATDVEPPTTPAEQRLVSAWAGVLGVAEDQIGRRDDFFDRGSSLTAVELVIALDGAITLKDIAGSPVLADLALLLDQEDAGPAGLLQPLSAPVDAPAPTLVCFPYAGGNAINYRAMAAELAPSGVAVHAVELPGHDLGDGSDDLVPLDEIVERIAEEVAELDPSTLLFWGHSSGAAFAIETARRLEGQGATVDRLFVAAQLPHDVATRRAHLAELAEQSDDEVATVLAADGGYTELHEFANGRATHIGAAYRHDCTAAHQVLIDAMEGPPVRKLVAPVTVVAAADDPSTAEAAERFTDWDLIANDVELHELSDGGHYFLRTRPAESAAAVLAAVETVSTNGHSAAAPEAELNGRSSDGSTINGRPANGSTVNGSPANGRPINGSSVNGGTRNGSPVNGAAALDVDVAEGHALVTASDGAGRGSAWLAEHRDDVRALVADHGAVVLRGLDLGDPAAVAEAASAVAGATMDDLEAFASRERYDGGVFSSSAWPTNQQMCMHHELSYRLESPGLMLFSCLTAPTEGGSIGVADASTVLDALPSDLVERFDREGWMLVRNYNGDIGSTVAEAFGTEDPEEIERYCRANDISVEWLDDGTLRTRQRRQAVVTHPVTGRRCWFNQVAFLSGWTMQPEVRDFLVEMYGPEGLPFDTRHGNGEPIAEEVIRRINEVYEANTTQLELSPGDVILVDNLRTAHGREPYEGDRQVVVAMAEPIRVDQLGHDEGAESHRNATRARAAGSTHTAPASTDTLTSMPDPFATPAPAPSRPSVRATPRSERFVRASRTPVNGAGRRPMPTDAVNGEVRPMTSPAITIVPVTVRASRALAHRPDEILAAYGDIRRRVRWQADPEEILVLEAHDFRIGGTDHFVYRSRHYPGLLGTVRYERIEDEVLVYTRTLADEDGRTVAISVVSWALQPCAAGTEVTIAEHTTSLDGSAPIEGSEYRLQTLLDRLSIELANFG